VGQATGIKVNGTYWHGLGSRPWRSALGFQSVGDHETECKVRSVNISGTLYPLSVRFAKKGPGGTGAQYEGGSRPNRRKKGESSHHPRVKERLPAPRPCVEIWCIARRKGAGKESTGEGKKWKNGAGTRGHRLGRVNNYWWPRKAKANTTGRSARIQAYRDGDVSKGEVLSA